VKTITRSQIPADWKGRRILLRFDGAQSDARVWVNSKEAGRHQGGFTAFEFDVTEYGLPGASNTVAAAVQNESTADILASGTQYAAYQFGGLTRKSCSRSNSGSSVKVVQIPSILVEASEAIFSMRAKALS